MGKYSLRGRREMEGGGGKWKGRARLGTYRSFIHCVIILDCYAQAMPYGNITIPTNLSFRKLFLGVYASPHFSVHVRTNF